MNYDAAVNRRLFAIAAVFTVAFIAFVVGVERDRPDLDMEVARWVAVSRSELGIDVAQAISVTGSAFVLVPLGVVYGLYLWRRDGWSPVNWLLLGTLGASVLYL